MTSHKRSISWIGESVFVLSALAGVTVNEGDRVRADVNSLDAPADAHVIVLKQRALPVRVVESPHEAIAPERTVALWLLCVPAL